jgi:FkbM family methyltransferase
MIPQVIQTKLQRWMESLGYLVVAKWRLAEPDVQKVFDSLGYVLVPKSRLSAGTVQLFDDAVDYFLVPKSRSWRLPGAVHLKRLFDLLRIDCVLDVGANLGQYRNFLRDEVGFEGLIVSFEPIPSHVRTLSERARSDELWVVEGYALGESTGEAPFNVMANSQFSSFLTPDHNAVELFEAENQISRQVTVPVRILDDVFPDIKRRFNCKSVYLKLDTQGYDLEVLKGAANTLSTIRALQTEASVKPIYKGMPDYTASIGTLEGLGFELSGIFANNSGHFPRLIEFDAVMVRRMLT